MNMDMTIATTIRRRSWRQITMMRDIHAPMKSEHWQSQWHADSRKLLSVILTKAAITIANIARSASITL
jgi:hypothetical protein